MTKLIAYKSRRHQFQDFIKEYKANTMSLQKLVKSVAMCAAAEERYRTLNLIGYGFAENLYDKIVAESVLSVLGYKD